MSSIKEDVIDLISQELKIVKEEIKDDSRFVEDLNADSLDVVELIMALEDKFKISIPDEEAEKIKTVENVINYIEQHAQK